MHISLKETVIHDKTVPKGLLRIHCDINKQVMNNIRIWQLFIYLFWLFIYLILI